jgi:putative DNA methylase
MEEFYKDHSHDPDTNGKVVLDPFMGGGTTIVEALRLGCKVVGIDLNPVAWFIVKTQVEPVDLEELNEAFARLADRIVPWSGKPLRQTLLDLYRTVPPWTVEEVCGLVNSDVIYTFWTKSAVCTSPTCRKQVPLFSNYILAAKSPSIRYYQDCKCPNCDAEFDWEVEPAALVPDPRLMFHGNTYSGGIGRSNARWTYAHEDGGIYVCQGKSIWKKNSNITESSPEWIHVLHQHQVKTGTLEAGHVCCPQCNDIIRPRLTAKKKKRKKVPLTVLLCPQTEDVFQWRGEIGPDAFVTSPAGFTFDPNKAHVTDKGRFICPHCGNNDAIIESIRSLPAAQLLPMHAYGIQAYAPGCDLGNDPGKNSGNHSDLFIGNGEPEEMENEEETGKSDGAYSGPMVPPTHNLVWKQSGKYYTRHSPSDQTLYSTAEALWQKNRDALPYPKSEIPSGQETDRLHDHHYHYWHQMFNARQMLALSTLLQSVCQEKNVKSRDLLLCACSITLETNNLFTRNIPSRRTPGGTAPAGVFARHDFQPKATLCEQNVWGTVSGNNTYISRMRALRQGIAYAQCPYDGDFDEAGKHCKREGLDPVPFDGQALLISGDSRAEIDKADGVDLVITDPPYADNVNYSELADFFYVWLRLALKAQDVQFAPEYCPKTSEIVENKSRGLSMQDFEEGLTTVLRKSGEKITDDGLVIFTFHHAEGSSWESVLNSVCNANLVIEAIYPVHSEREASLHLQDNEAIAYDLIHVCRKRRQEDTRAKRSWAGLRQLVRQRAREEIVRIESGRYGGQPLPASDIRMVLIGKCLEIYSRHFGAVLDWNGEPFPLNSTTEGEPSALKDIRMMVEQIVSRETPLPSELESVDAFSQVWLLALCDKREVSVDSISKLTRGIFEVSDLTCHKPPLLRKGRVKGGRTYEVLTPLERLDALRQTLRGAESTSEQLSLLTSTDNAPIVIGPELVDVIHLLAGNAEQGERLDLLVERFRGQREQIRAALHYLKQRDPDRWTKACDKLLPFYDDLFAQATLEKGNH